MKQRYFGTDGIRGRMGDDVINAEFVLKLGWATGKVLAQDPAAKVVVGRDTRVSGKVLQSALIAGLASSGVDVFILGVLPTPAVAHLTHSLRASAGIVISASHNPYEDNGFKFFDGRGMKLSDEHERAIEKQIAVPMSTTASADLGRVRWLRDARGRYIEFCKSTFPNQLKLNNLKIIVDCANGAAAGVASTIFYELGAEVVTMGDQPDGLNINQACGATAVEALQCKVLKEKADIGIALDGDGDRLIMIDQKGEVVDGDEILCILAKDTSTGMRSRQGVVGTVMSNLGLEQALTAASVDFTRAPVGDRFVLEEMIKRGWALGGESSGHIVNLDYTTTGDGIITALQVLRVMLLAKQSLHELKQAMVKRPQVLINVPISNVVDLNQYPKITAAITATEKDLAERGRVLVRPSGTQPYVRVMVEGNDAAEVQTAAEQLANTIQQELTP